jgi:hypothetical protein
MSSQPNNSEFIAISTKSSYPPTAKLFCNRCGCNLVIMDPRNEDWFCNRCGISYYPNKQPVKRPNKFETPKGSDPDNRNKVPLVSFVDDEPQLSTRTSTLPPSLKALKERTGVNITSFHSTVDDEAL